MPYVARRLAAAFDFALAAARVLAGITQEQLAERAGLHVKSWI
jgi:DNA-binding XRE family transcriptional regulator